MTTEEETTVNPVVEESKQIEEAVPVEQGEEFQTAVDTETGKEDTQDAEADDPEVVETVDHEDAEAAGPKDAEDSEPEGKEEVKAGANDATSNDVHMATPATSQSNPTAVASKSDEEDRRADVEKQPYEFEKCTVQIAVQFLPEDGDAKGRPVLLGVCTHLDAPIIRVLRLSELGELPPTINALVDQLKSELPAREQATKERIEKEKRESLQRRLRTAKPALSRQSKHAISEKPKDLQATATPARTVLTANQRANAVDQAANEKQQLAMF